MKFTKKTMDELERLSIKEVAQSKKNDIIIILDNVRSMQNVGSIFRTADSFSVHSLYLCGFTPIPPHRDIHKTALGAENSVSWTHFKTTEEAIEKAINMGFKICAVEQTHNSTYLHNFKLEHNKKIALIFGNEVDGVSNQVLELCTQCIEIPQWGSKHSLNISVSLGVVVWEIVKQIQ